VQVHFVGPLTAGATTVRVSVTASDDQGLKAVQFFSPAQDSVVGGRALSGTRQTFEQVLSVRPLKAGAYRLEATVADVGGNLTHTQISGTVGK
jgi:hypothetical protein